MEWFTALYLEYAIKGRQIETLPESVNEDFDLQSARFAFSADFIEGYDEVNQVLILKGILQGLLEITQGLEEKVQSEQSLMALSAERETRKLFDRMRKKKNGERGEN